MIGERLWHHMGDALRSRQTFVLETFLAVQSITWGAWVASPMFDAFVSVPQAYSLLVWLPEWLVGGAFVVHGCAHMYVIYLRDVRLCRNAAMGAVGLWGLVLMNMLVSVPLSTATPIYLCSVLASLWVYVRLDWRVR